MEIVKSKDYQRTFHLVAKLYLAMYISYKYLGFNIDSQIKFGNQLNVRISYLANMP